MNRLKYSRFKTQYLISTGVVTLDHIIGGGLPLGSILLLEEDEAGSFALLILKHFIADGIVNGHSVFVGSRKVPPENILHNLPDRADVKNEMSEIPNEEMRIAWRYQNNPQMDSSPLPQGRGSFNEFDVTKVMSQKEVDSGDISTWPSAAFPNKIHLAECGLDYLLLSVKTVMIEKGYWRKKDEKPENNVLRIALHSIGTHHWPDKEEKLLGFITILRAFIENTNVVVLVTLPKHLLKDFSVVTRCEQMSDCVIRLDCLNTKNDQLYKDYSGLVNTMKLPVLFSLTTPKLETKDWAFKIHRKRFLIQKLHLPPELQTSTQREQDVHTQLPCASSGSIPLQF